MSTFSQDFILSKEHSLDTTHETSSLTVQVTVDFLLKGGLVEVPGADTDTEGDGFFRGFAGHVLEDGEGRVDTSALFEETADCSAGTFGCDEDDVDVGRGNDTSEVFVHDGETVGEVQGLESVGELNGNNLALSEEGLNLGPCLALSGILKSVVANKRIYREKVHDDCSLLDGLFHIEKILSWNPAIFLGLFPRSSVLTNTDNDIQSVVTGV
jgi:hypothetical protein